MATAVEKDTKPREQLDAEMIDALLRLQLMPQIGAQKFNTSGHTHPDSRPPPGVGTGDSYPEYERFRDLYNDAEDDEHREQVLKSALQTIKYWSPRHDSVPEGVDFEKIVLQDGEGYDAEHVAQKFGIAPSYVHNIRRRARVRADDGRPVDPAQLSIAERRLEVRRLKVEKNLTVRQIAQIVGVSTFTVSTDLRSVLDQ